MNHVSEAARRLWLHRVEGTVLDDLPEAERPRDAREGHAIQAELPHVTGQAVVGWKIAATGEAGQRHINVPGPLAGRILTSFVYEEGARLSLVGNRMRVAEPEFAFRFARTLAPRAKPYGVDEVMAAVESLHPALEIPDSRFAVFTRAGQAQLIADDACCGRFIVGPAAPAAWRSIDLRAHAVRGTVTHAGSAAALEREGEGRNVLGDPCVALTWLVNELCGSLNIPIEAGQFVSTGTCMVPLAIAPGDVVHADFGVIGSVSAGFDD
jgi:2-keto-4-pentenoate hydratase